MSAYTPSVYFPSLIRQEYEKCKTELENCSYYGAVFALKDNFECILKLYVLCGAVKLHREQGQELILKLLCNPQKQPSMGTWLAELLPLCEEELEGEQEWKQSFSILKKQYQKWNIVKWRNDSVGHGALRLSSDKDFISDLQERFVQLQELLQKLEIYAAQIDWGLQEILEPYFTNQDGKLCCLDGVMHGKGVWLCYEDGKRYVSEHKEISGTLKRYYGDLHVSYEQGIQDEIYPAEVDAALDAYYKADNYCKPTYMKTWLQGCLDRYDKGVFLLKADRGTGKSAFCYAVDELAGNKIKLVDTACRTYFCNRTALRNIEDFVMQVSRIFYRTADGQEWRSRTMQGMKTLQSEQENRQTVMCECLTAGLEFQKKQGKNKILLILDGLDELTHNNEPILEFIPRAEMLPSNVYILLTVRADQPDNRRIDGWLEQTALTEVKQFDRKEENAALLRNAVIKAASKALTEEQILKTLEVLDYRFSGLKVWESMSAVGLEAVFWQNTSGDVVTHFLKLLQQYYGQYVERLNLMFCALAMEEIPLDMCTLSVLSGDATLQIGTLAVLYDLKPLYIPEHDRNGGLFLWKYSEEMQELAVKNKEFLQRLALLWEKMLEDLSQVYPWQRNGYLYMATHIYDIWEKAFGNPEELSEKFLLENMQRMAVLIGGSEQYIEAIWHLNALEKTVAIERDRGNSEGRICFIALVEMLHPLVSLKEYRRAHIIMLQLEEILGKREEEWKKSAEMLPMLWQYYSDTLIIYAELNDMVRAEEQYRKALRLPEVLECTLSLRMNHMNMIKQNQPEKCLAECREIELRLPQEAEQQRANIYHTMAVACEQLARMGKLEYIGKEKEYLEKGIEILQKLPLHPECFPANRVLALELESLARWYAGWKHDLTAALQNMEQVRQILMFHSQFQNLVPPEDIFRVYLFLARWYAERKEEGDTETAKRVLAAIEKMYANLTVELSPMLHSVIQNDILLLMGMLSS